VATPTTPATYTLYVLLALNKPPQTADERRCGNAEASGIQGAPPGRECPRPGRLAPDRTDGTTWTVQAKRRKTVAQYLTCDGADVVVTREDRGENLVVLPLDRFLSLLKETADPLERLLNELDDRQDLSDLLDELDSGADLNGLLEDLEGRTDLDALLKELKADD